MKLNRLFGTAACVALGAFSVSASAQDSDIQKQIDDLKKKIESLEKKAVIVKKSDPAPVLGTLDGKHEMNMRGRLLVDFGWASDKDGGVNVDAAKLRGAWLGIQGKVSDNVSYMFEGDFGSNKVSMKDAKVTLKAAGGKITIGHFKQTNSMELLTSGTQTTFLERSAMVSAFGLGRAVGASYGTNGDNWSAAVGLYRGGAGTAENDEGLMVTGRATYGGKTDSGTWMVGGSFRSRDTGDAGISYKAKAHNNLAPTGASVSGTNKDTFMGAEFGASFGAFHVGSEYGTITAKNADAGANANFNSANIEVGYFLTGENKPLSLTSGSWGRPKVNKPFGNGGSGAWQLVAKYDTLDLNDGALLGGKQDTVVFGVNWYLNRFTRFVANYSNTKIKGADVAKWGGDGKNSIDTFGLRFQVDW